MILLPEMEQEAKVNQQATAFCKDVREPDTLHPDNQRNG